MNARALLAALLTIAVWSSLALLADRIKLVPPLLSAGLALMVGGLVGAWQKAAWLAPWRTYALGIGGLFGYHTLLFAAFGLAPAVEVNLLQYLWPLLIVLLTPLFSPRHRLDVQHILGAVLGCVGAMMILGGAQASLSKQYALGYFCAIAAAFVWASYSLGCRRIAAFPTAAISACCLVAGVGSVLLHLVWYGPAAAMTLTDSDFWMIVVMGVGPMGLAFLTWDIALKHGDPRAIGALAYLTPLLSTLLLILVNGHGFSTQTGFAAGAILLGAILGNRLLPQNFSRLLISKKPEEYS